MIVLENVNKSYGPHRVLRGISMQVNQGDFISVMGSSGSGKSTLLNIIGGMDRPESGKVLVHARDITSFSDEQLTRYRRKTVGFVFQFFNLLPNLTVYENIEMPLLLNGHENNRKVMSFIQRVRLEGKEHAYPFELSGGEQQRVSIARALIHEPEILLADEPTGSLDSLTGRTVMDLIVEMAHETHKTLILVTHESYIADYAEKTVRIRDGMLLR
jgi:ABC-type lipoprotein export system ATPase subunit